MGQNFVKSVEAKMNRYCFISNNFNIEANEDNYTNPGIYGKNFAKWLANKLSSLSYKIDDIFPEDWGWCILLENGKLIACNGEYYNNKIIWSCFCDDENKEIYKILDNNFNLINCP